MKAKIIIFSLILGLVSELINAQDSTMANYKNIVKMNLAAAAFRKVSVGYEYYFNDRWSAIASAGYKMGGGIPKFIGLGDFAIASSTGGIKGFSISTAGRYHFKKCDCGDRTGLYGGLYLTTTKLWGELEFNYWNGTDYIDVGGAGDMQEYGIGLQLGYQVVIKKRFIIDMMFMGPRTSFQRLKLELDSQFAAEVLPIIEEKINERLDWWGMDPISIPTDPSAVIDFRFNNFRYSIGVGYLF